MTTFNLTKTDNLQDCSILQGKSYRLGISYLGADVSAYTPRGQIRKNYAFKDPIVLTEFSFSELIFDEINNKTTFVASLSASQTAGLPIIPRKRLDSSEAPIPGINVWVYDIEIVLGDEVLPILSGYIEIKPEVTV